MSDEWFKVLVDDHGIRPAGKSNECFYCKSLVGQDHRRDCVVITKMVEVDIHIKVAGGFVRGVWIKEMPYSYNKDSIMFYLNESSWCASNIIDVWDDIVWGETSKGAAQKLYNKIDVDEKAGFSCICEDFEATSVKEVDGRPIRSNS